MAMIAVAIAFLLLQDKPAVQAARPQRTEAEARARADENRRRGAEERRKTGAPVELIADYLAAVVRPVPAELGVSAFYRMSASNGGSDAANSSGVSSAFVR